MSEACQPILRSGWPSDRPGVPGSTMKVGDAPVPVRRGAGGHHEHVGEAGVGDEHLGAVEPVAAAVRGGPGGDAGHVRAGARLGDGDDGELLPGDQGRQVAGLLLVGAELRDVRGRHVAADQRGDRDAAAGPGQLLGQDADRQGVSPAAAVLLGDAQAEQAARPSP